MCKKVNMKLIQSVLRVPEVISFFLQRVCENEKYELTDVQFEKIVNTIQMIFMQSELISLARASVLVIEN